MCLASISSPHLFHGFFIRGAYNLVRDVGQVKPETGEGIEKRRKGGRDPTLGLMLVLCARLRSVRGAVHVAAHQSGVSQIRSSFIEALQCAGLFISQDMWYNKEERGLCSLVVARVCFLWDAVP